MADRYSGAAMRRRQRPWPRTNTTQHQGDRRRPGLERGGASRTTRRRSGRLPFSSRSSSICRLTKSSAGRGLTGSLGSGRRSRHSGTPWSSLQASLPRCSFLMILADGGPARGDLQACGHRVARAGYRRAQDLTRQNRAALC